MCKAIGNHFRAVIVESEPIDQRAFFWITKNARARIARLRLRSHSSNFNKRKSERFPRRERDAIFIQTSGEPDAMMKIQPEYRHRRGLFSRFWKQRCGDAAHREREVMGGFGVERKETRAEKALVNHSCSRWRALIASGLSAFSFAPPIHR